MHASTRFFRLIGTMAIALVLAQPAIASSDSGRLLRVQLPQQSFLHGNILLSAKEFFEAYVSKDDAARQRAEVFLVGVLDATEGKEWCSYAKFKTDTLGEAVYMEVGKLSEQQLKERAAHIITGILKRRFPCKPGQRRE